MTELAPARPAHLENLPATTLGTLGLMSAMAPVAMNLYLPAFPDMMRELETSAFGIQLSVTAFLVGGGLGQLIFGPLSDRYGRRPPLLLGTSFCFAACLVAAFAPNLELLIVARLLGGLTASAGMVLSRTVVTDLLSGRAAARSLSLMMLIGGVAPVVAPPVGALLLGPIGWHGVLLVVAATAGVTLLAVVAWLPESYPTGMRVEHRELRRTGQGTGLGSAAYLGNMLAFGFAMAGFMAYVTASSVLFQLAWEADSTTYGLLFGFGSLLLLAGNAASAAAAGRFPAQRLLSFGLLIMLLGTMGFFAVVSSASGLWAVVPIYLVLVGLGFVMGNATALALASVPHAAGQGSAWLGATQYGLGALASAAVGLGSEQSAQPVAIVLFVCVLAALVSHVVALRRKP